MEDEVLGELLGEIKSTKKRSEAVQPKLPKLCPAAKPAASASVNPFRSTGIKRPKRPLANSGSENFDSDIRDFDDDHVVADADAPKPTQTIDDFGDDADFDDVDLMEIEEVTTQEIEKEKENRLAYICFSTNRGGPVHGLAF
jgi:hypothetical protein